MTSKKLLFLFFALTQVAVADLTPGYTVVQRFKTPLELRRELRSASQTGKTVTLAVMVANKVAATNSPTTKKPTETVAAATIKITGSTIYKNRIQ